MKLSDFSYELPEELIAYYPAEQRSQSRLLCLNGQTGEIEHRIFSDLPELLNPKDLLVFNDTRVIPARLYGHKESGGKFELLIERIESGNSALVQIKSSKSPRPGTKLYFHERGSFEEDDSEEKAETQWSATLIGKQDNFYKIEFPAEVNISQLLSQIGHIPLPPYIKREDELTDSDRYQTIYAKQDGAVAAPTAGLHFDKNLLASISAKGVDTTFITLHVGAGTFVPVRVDDINEHKMHAEWIEVSNEVCEKIAACKARGGRVIAVGTTTVRSLETAAADGKLQAYCGDTDIFIFPGYEFKVVDAMLTNFHLSESTLLMLVSAYCNKEMLLGAYAEAVEKRYRFFSYGDAMFVHR